MYNCAFGARYLAGAGRPALYLGIRVGTVEYTPATIRVYGRVPTHVAFARSR